MIVEELTKEHLRSIKVREIERYDLGDNILNWEDEYLSSHYKKAIINEGEVVVIMGGLVENNKCHTWLLGSDLMYSFPIATMKLVKRLHQEAIQLHNVSLFFTYNLPDLIREIKFVEAIGYKRKDLYGFDDGKNRFLLEMEVS